MNCIIRLFKTISSVYTYIALRGHCSRGKIAFPGPLDEARWLVAEKQVKINTRFNVNI